jgi:chloramphenicol O-acetyltransferase type A
MTYLLTYTANQLENFRWRIRGNEVIEHEIIHPSITLLASDDLFSFCTREYVPEFTKFADGTVQTIAHICDNPSGR